MGRHLATMPICWGQMVFCEVLDSKVPFICAPPVDWDLTLLQGYVVSDWGATHDSAEENANAGLEMEQPGDYIVIGSLRRCLARA